MRKYFLAILVCVTYIVGSVPTAASVATSEAAQPTVMQVSVIPVDRAAALLRTLYPHARVTIDSNAGTLIVVAPPSEIASMKRVLQGIDVNNPRRSVPEAIALHFASLREVGGELARLYPSASIEEGPNKTLLVVASPPDLAEIKALVDAVDVSPTAGATSEVVRITQGNPRAIARTTAAEVSDVRADVSGSNVILTGPSDEVTRAKSIAEAIDQPAEATRYSQVYRLRFVDAASVANLISHAFRDASVSIDKNLNAVIVSATGAEQTRIGAGIAQLDVASAPTVAVPGSAETTTGPSGTTVAVVNLKAATPGINGSISTTSSDIANTVMQSLSPTSPDLHITIQPNSTQLVLTGSASSVQLAKDLIAQLDTTQDLVVLDTEILEVDQTVAKDLGITAGTPGSPFLSTTIGEYPPQVPSGSTASPPPFFSLQSLTRTPLSLNVSLNALIQNGNARILADPRITTISGRTATIRAGDNISVLTTTPASVGVPSTSQIQTFQTGVTLDITPVINSGNFITVYLHPTVNSLSSTNSEGIPQISTRDTQTTVGMEEDQTLIIGGLIEDDTTSSEQKIPLLSDLPLIGKVFRGYNYSHERNELVITVTPHIIHPRSGTSPALPGTPTLPTPMPLPTIAPDTAFPLITATSRRPAATPARTTAQRFVQAYAPPLGLTPTPRPSLAPGQRPEYNAPEDSPAPLQLSSMTGPPGTYTYGQPPANIIAGPNDTASIFYVTFSPNAVSNGTPVNFTAITSTNVERLVLLGGNSTLTAIQSSSPGHWQAAFNFNAAQLPPNATSEPITLTAVKQDGTSVSIQFPVTVTQCQAAAQPTSRPFGLPGLSTPAPC